MNKHFERPKAYSLDRVTMVMKPVCRIYYKDNDDADFIEFLVSGIGSFRQHDDGRCFPLPDVKSDHYREFPYRIFDSELEAWEFEHKKVKLATDRLSRMSLAILHNIDEIKTRLSQNETKPPQQVNSSIDLIA